LSTLRLITAADISMVADLHAACFAEERWDARAIADVLAMPGAFGIGAIADRAGDALGFALAREAAGECEILSLGVHPAHRRHGIGRRLLQATLASAVARGAVRAYLEVAEDNYPACNLYFVQGFAIIGTRPNYYPRPSTGPGNALLLGCDLD